MTYLGDAHVGRDERSEVERKVITVESGQAKNLLAEQEARLNRSGWIDREQGVVAIPIDRAMQLVVDELGKSSFLASPRPRGGEG